MQKRKFDELVSYFNKKVSEMEIETKYKMELLGMVTALGCAHEKEMSDLSETKQDSSDTISRKAAIEAVYKCTDIYINNLPVMVDKADAYKALAELPSAPPRRLRGRWVETERRGVLAGAKYYKCNMCAQAIVVVDSTPMDDGYNYCPRCGSQMTEEQT